MDATNKVCPRLYRPLRAAAAVVALLAGMAAANSAAAGEQTDPRALLKAMSDYIGAQKDVAFNYDSIVEIVTTEGDKAQLASSGGVRLSRPDKLHVTRTGGFADVELLFDGKQTTLVGKNSGVFVQAAATAPTVDGLIDHLRDDLGLSVPAADLLMGDGYSDLIGPVTDAKFLGSGIIGGTECDHLLFHTDTVTWEIWIQDGGPPIPCRYVVISRLLPQAPEYTIQVSDWRTGAAAGDDTFTFAPASGVKEVTIGQLQDFDEVPAAYSAGAKP